MREPAKLRPPIAQANVCSCVENRLLKVARIDQRLIVFDREGKRPSGWNHRPDADDSTCLDFNTLPNREPWISVKLLRFLARNVRMLDFDLRL